MEIIQLDPLGKLTAPAENSSNAEVVIKLVWYNVARLTDTITATDVASVVTPFLEQFSLAPTNGGPRSSSDRW